MNRGDSSVRATLDAWRECGANRLDPVRFHFIEALERRSAAHVGEARCLLDKRLSGLLDVYASDLEHAAEQAGEHARQVAGVASTGEPARSGLANLIDYIANQAPVDAGSPREDSAWQAVRGLHGPEPGRATAHDRASPIDPASSHPELELLHYFRETWSRLSTTRQLRQSREEVPGNAGPLNSSSLIYRALTLMGEHSPSYLQQFLSYVDALSSLDQMLGAGVPPNTDAPRATNARKSVRGKQR
jgi:hypothetical protein